MCGAFTAVVWLYVNASPPPDFVVSVRGIRTRCGSWHRMWSVIAPAPASVLRVIFATCGARYQSYRDCLTTPRPVGPPCELPANLVRVAGPMMSSNPPSMEATLAHACRPLFYTHVPPTNTAVRSVPVSACRLLVFTKLTEGAVFVGGCEADGSSA